MFGLSFGASVLIFLTIILGGCSLFVAFIFWMEYQANKALKCPEEYLYQVSDADVLKIKTPT